MISPEAKRIRSQLVKDTGDPGTSLHEERGAWLASAEAVTLPSEVTIETRELGGVPCLFISHPTTTDKVILYVHGGGYVAGSPLTHAEFAARLCLATNALVVLPDYRLLPEHPFPAPVTDVLIVYRELTNADGHKPQNVTLGGDSSGASLVLSALVDLRDAGSPLPACAFSISGAFDATLSGQSMQANLDPTLSIEALKLWQSRLGSDLALDDPMISPLFANLSALPPVLLLAGGHDLWFDDTIRLADKIARANGTVDLRVWDEMWHVWPMVPAMPEAEAALATIRDFLVDQR